MAEINWENYIKSLPYFNHIVLRGTAPLRSDDKSGLNFTQEKTLLILDDRSYLTQRELGRHINIEKGAFSRVIHGLVEDGMVKRNRLKEDKRVVQLKLTKKGKNTVEEIRKRLSRHFREILSVLNSDEKTKLKEALCVIGATAEKIEHRRKQ